MEEMIEQRLVLSAADLHLLAQTLGAASWNDVPLTDQTEDLEKLFLESFLHLADMGLLIPSKHNRYRLTEEARRLLLPLTDPERKSVLLMHNGAAILYERDGVQRILYVDSDGKNSTLGETENGMDALVSRLQISESIYQEIDVTATPPEHFSEKTAPAEIMEDSEALFLVSEPEQGKKRYARVFFAEMVPWFSALKEGAVPVRYEEQILRRWLEKKEETE